MSTALVRAPVAWASHDLRPRLAVTCSVLAMALVIGLDLIDWKLGSVFSVGFVLIALTAPLAVEARGLFTTALLPPALLFGALFAVALFFGDAIHVEGMPASAGVFGRTLSAIVDHGVVLVIGHGLALLAVGFRVVTAPRG